MVRGRKLCRSAKLIPLSPYGSDELGIGGVGLQLFAQVQDMYHDGIVGGGEEFFAPDALVDLLHIHGPAPILDEEPQNGEFLVCQVDALAVADIVLSRAGSNTLSELLALQKPMLLVPYPKGASRGDQILNAESFRARSLSRVMDQKDMNVESLVKAVVSLYRDRGEIYDAMAKENTANGVDNVLEIIFKYAKK